MREQVEFCKNFKVAVRQIVRLCLQAQPVVRVGGFIEIPKEMLVKNQVLRDLVFDKLVQTCLVGA